ncbi:phosphopantetheine adenylyltransferase [Bacteroidia bacterium]|nr:phosphopantetheine adenylyltransferase [Bacteroidia bacterium]
MCKIAIFPGSFDPFTIGHLSLVERGLLLVDEIIIAIGANTDKKTYFSLDERVRMISELFKSNVKIKIRTYEGLTATFAEEVGARFILRGVRTINDFEYEKTVANVNRKISGIETLVLFTEPEYSHISSTVVRELLIYKKSVQNFVPNGLNMNENKN